MRFADAMVALRAGKKIFCKDVSPFGLSDVGDTIPISYMDRDDWRVFEAPLSDAQLIEYYEAQAAKLEAEAEKRELQRLAAWETRKAEGGVEPEKPRGARSSIAMAYRRFAATLKTRQILA